MDPWNSLTASCPGHSNTCDMSTSPYIRSRLFDFKDVVQQIKDFQANMPNESINMRYLQVPTQGNFSKKPTQSSFLYADLDHSSEDDQCDRSSIGSVNSRISSRNSSLSKFNHSKSSDNAKNPLDVVCELVKKENEFIKSLDVLVKLKEIMESHLPNELVRASILRYIPELHKIHITLSKELSERVQDWEKRPKISDILLTTGQTLKTYNFYIKNFSSFMTSLEEAIKNNPAFAKALKELEQKKCQSLTVRDFIHRPVQRLLQYKLFLERYKRYLEKDHPDYEDSIKALLQFSLINDSVNKLVLETDGALKMLDIQNSLVKGEIVKPGRILLKIGELMKVSRREEQPRLFLLCNDCLMYMTPQPTGSLRLNHELSIEEMSVKRNPRFENEFHIISKSRSLSVKAGSSKEREEWVIAIEAAIDEFHTRRGNGTKLKEDQNQRLGDVAPVWIPDNRVTMCQRCPAEFTFSFRRHHCRACGHVVCVNCSSNRAPLKYLGFKTGRVCDICFAILQENITSQIEKAPSILSKGSSSEISIDLENESFNNSKSLTYQPDLEQLKAEFVRMPIRSSTRKRDKPRRLMISADDKDFSISGYLLYKEDHHKKWKKGWFGIKENVIYIFKESNDSAALQSIPILSYEVEVLSDGQDNLADKGHVFQLSHPGQKPLFFKADTEESAIRWVNEIKAKTHL